MYIKQPHLKYTCQAAVIVKAAPAVLCTLPDPRPVKCAMLNQEGVLLCPAPDPRSVRALPSQITGLRVWRFLGIVPVLIHARDTFFFFIIIMIFFFFFAAFT